MPLAIDLFCGKGGWSRGLMDAGWQVIGFDIANMGGYPSELVLQDVLTIHGSQFRNASLIVASPPCQKYSYMAMPWSRAKMMAAEYRANPERIDGELNLLFNACFRIQREASEAAGHHIPMVVENVLGAQSWVGRAAWHYGSFYLWGDVPALMPMTRSRKVPGFNFHQHEKTGKPGGSFQSAAVETAGLKIPGQDWSRFAKTGQVSPHWRMQADGFKTNGHANKRDGHTHTRHLTNQRESDAVKCGGDWFGAGSDSSQQRRHGSKSDSRKEASARIAMIPYDLALHIGRVYL